MAAQPSETNVTLADEGRELEATFLPGAGMLCCSLRHRGGELLAQNAGIDAYVSRGKTMGVPLLYPWANRLAAFSFNQAGRTAVVPHDGSLVGLDGNGLPIHGVIGGRLDWEPLATAADELHARLRWTSDAGERFAVFPYEHEVRYEARLAAGELSVAVTVEACAGDSVPVAFGFHPYLEPPGATREALHVQLPQMRHLELDAQQIPAAPGAPIAAENFALARREYDDGFDCVADGALFAVVGGSRRIELEFLEGYPCAQVYAPPGRAFICFEPMTAPANALVSGTGLRVLAPGERARAAFAIRVRDV